MRITTCSSDQRQAVDRLLEHYAAYRAASTPMEKHAIGEMMRFSDPTVWLLYKYEAYQDTTEALTTWGDLCEHSLHDDGICGRRLDFLLSQYTRLTGHGGDLRLGISPLTPLPDVLAHPAWIALTADQQTIAEWHEHEYTEVNGSPAKWSRYTHGQSGTVCHH